MKENPAKDPIRYCKFKAVGHTYCGVIRGSMVDIVDGDLFSNFRTTRMRYPLDQVQLQVPFDVRTLWCVGRNYLGHIKELDHEVPSEPCLFIKSREAIIATNEPVRIPSWIGRVDYEGELAIVIGKKCHKVEEHHALSYVLGYTCLNDVTARDLQNRDNQWARCKSFDTFAPMGPCVLLTQELPLHTTVTTRLNNTIMQQDSIAKMIFSIPRIISYISQFTTLVPGDVIATGTPQGVGPVKAGDRVEIHVEGIGALQNPFIADL